MYKHILKALESEVSGDIAFNFLSDISRYHRIQASPDIRDAVKYAVDVLNRYGLDARVHSYPSTAESYHWSCHQFKEWDCRDAELRIVEPREKARSLARWSETRSCLVERSHPTPVEGYETEVVVLNDGLEEVDYNGVDVEGKIVVTKGDLARVYDLAVRRRGALGIIYDGMKVIASVRREGDLDDALERGRSGGWSGDDEPCFAFILTPRSGRRLRRLVNKQKEQGDVVKVCARVDSRFYDGTIENAVATIPGKTDEEVVVIAHICHPRGYANDNASGCGALMEVARAIRKLIDYGVFTKPRRTIRFTLVPEMTGTFAWLTENETSIPNMVAAVNLDMVGENQSLSGGSFNGVKTPDSNPSFVNYLMQSIIEEVMTDNDGKPLYKYLMTSFSAGSDHYIYSDPSVGVPCIMLCHLPDKFYHTSYDTLDKVDHEMLRKASLIAATYAYFIANAGVEEALWLIFEVAAHVKRHLTATSQKLITETLNSSKESLHPECMFSEAITKISRKMMYETEIGLNSIKSIKQLSRDNDNVIEYEKKLLSEVQDYSKNEQGLSEQAIRNFAKVNGLQLINQIKEQSDIEKLATEIVPQRIYRGPMRPGSYTHRSWLYKLSEVERDNLWRLEEEHKKSSILKNASIYWTNGERNLMKISQLAELETGKKNLEYILGYFNLLKKMGLLKYKQN
jgi:aminopeptidase-like protein